MRTRRITRRTVIAGGALAPTAARALGIKSGGGAGVIHPTITGPTSTGYTIMGGSANQNVGAVTFLTNPSGQFTSGTVALSGSGTDNSKFVMGPSSAGSATLSVGSVGISPATYNLTVSGTQDAFNNNGVAFAITVTVLPASASQAFIVSAPTGTPTDHTGWWDGMSFTVGSTNLSVSQVGRFIVSGNAAPHNVWFVDATSLQQVGPMLLVQPPYTPGDYQYQTYSSPVILTAGHTYYLLSDETTQHSGVNDLLYTNNVTYSSTSDAAINGSIWVYIAYSNQLVLNTGSICFGPVNFKYALAPNTIGTLAGSPFPPIGRAYSVAQATAGADVVTGLYTLDLEHDWCQTEGGNVPNINTITAQWWMDGQPFSPYIRGPQGVDNQTPPVFPYTFDSNTLSDGTHVAYIQMLDSTDNLSNGGSCSYIMMGQIKNLIVQNHGGLSQTTPQVVPATAQTGSSRAIPPYPAFVNYPGTTVRSVNTFDYPMPFVPPANIGGSPNAANPYANGTFPGGVAALRNAVSYYIASILHTKLNEYELDTNVATTPSGGVCFNYTQSIHGADPVIDIQAITCVYQWQGGRYDARVTAYSTWVGDPAPPAGHNGLPNASVPGGFYATQGFTCIMLSGCVLHMDLNGETQRVAGLFWNRASTLPYEDNIAQRIATGQQAGDQFIPYAEFGSAPWTKQQWTGLNDLCYDPRNHSIIYITNVVYNYIGKIDTSANPPLVTLYAGIPGPPGYSGDGGPATSATFNQPYSIIMADGSVSGYPAGTMFVADKYNSAIRMITPGGTISTLCGNQVNKPTQAQVCAADSGTVGGVPVNWNPTGSVAFGGSSSGAYTNFPNTIRFTSDPSKILMYELDTKTMRTLDLTGSQVTRSPCGYANLQSTRQLTPGNGFGFFDIDTNGTCGPVDDVLVIDFVFESRRYSLDGSYQAGFEGNPEHAGPQNVQWNGGALEGPRGSNPFNAIEVLDPLGGYTWLITFHKAQAIMLTGGFQILGVSCWRCALPSDPNPQFDFQTFMSGYYLWNHTSFGFPNNTHSSLAMLHGGYCFGHAGSDIAPTGHDMAVVYNGGTAAYNSGTVVPIATMVASGNAIAISLTGGNQAFVSGPSGLVGQRVMISGATNTGSGGNSAVNGFFLVTSFTSNQSFTVTVPVAPGSGTITPGVLNYGDAVFNAYIQSGAGSYHSDGVTPELRPELDPSGNDWRQLSYFIRRNTTAGTYPTPALEGPSNPDIVTPQILTMTAVRNSFTSITVSWTTDKQTIGLACGASDANFTHPFSVSPWLNGQPTPMPYSSWTPLESSFGMSHSATLTWLPMSLPTHVSVVVKDKAGNFAYAQDLVVGATPDRTFIGNGNPTSNKLVTQYGEWSFGPEVAPAPGYGGGPFFQVLLNGKPFGSDFIVYSANMLEVDFGGNVYAAGLDLNWSGWGGYEWQANGGFDLSGPQAPNVPSSGDNILPALPSGFNPPYNPSPDGTTSSTGPLVSVDGTWTIDGLGHVTLNNIALGGAQNSFTSGNMLEINAHGQGFYRDLSGNWHVWQNHTFMPVTGSPPSGGIPTGFYYTAFAGGGPFANIINTTSANTVLATISAITMSDGSTFSGTISIIDAGGFGQVPAISVNNLTVPAHSGNLTTGGYWSVVTLTQNGCGVQLPFNYQVHT